MRGYQETEEADFEILNGKIIMAIQGAVRHSREIVFTLLDGTECVLEHDQGCCETVFVEEVVGDITDLLGEEILEAECVVSTNETPDAVPRPKDYEDYSFTWTFYKLGTKKGFVNIRWYGCSNGYYSEKVDFKIRIKEPDHD
jgi:hypothetical protein